MGIVFDEENEAVFQLNLRIFKQMFPIKLKIDMSSVLFPTLYSYQLCCIDLFPIWNPLISPNPHMMGT